VATDQATAADAKQMYIGGEWVGASSGETTEVLSPATTQPLATVQSGSAADVDAAVRAAREALAGEWGQTPPRGRAEVMGRIAGLIMQNLEELAALESANVGKPIKEAMAMDVPASAGSFAYYAGWADKAYGQTIPHSMMPVLNYTIREPIGVVGAIVPWNFPLAIATWKIAPALATGNAVVLKPAALTPLSVLRLAELAAEAGLPAGVLNVITGPGREVGEAMAAHPGIGKIAFTGSTEVGRGIAAGAAATIKRVTLELGGKSANLVFADADIEAAAAAAPGAVFGNAGQDCCARSRILVQRSAVDDFLAAMAPHVEALRVGDPLAESTQMGPLISAGQRTAVAAYVPDDAPVAIRGSAPEGPGYWFPPTVLAPVSNAERAAREEIFGPVVCVIPFDDEADAIALANETIYGLSGSIWTRDGGRALRVARAVEAGVLSINSNTSVRVSTPFGGFKQSGVGRELGPDALEHYTEVKNVYYATTED